MTERIYDTNDSLITGGLMDPTRIRVRFTQVFSSRQKTLLSILGILIIGINIAFIVWFLHPSHLQQGSSLWLSVLAVVCFIAILFIELVRIVQAVTLWLFAAKSVDPVPYTVPTDLRVAILTTIVPSKEPIELVKRTLLAMKRIKYEGRMDVWILDEGDDERVQAMAHSIGVRYFTREGIASFNQASGEFKARSKAGNHNAWRSCHEHEYDVVAQMDPDHIPLPNFLERTLGYFHDKNIAFVVAPQVYGNQSDRWLTRASASQAYIFHGIIQRGGNGFGSPLLIGTNHLYRPVAWKQIGGYQDSIIEDHLTSMKIHGTVNPETMEHWTSVYTPDVISVGEGPTSWTDYFNQQKRWAYGIWEIVLSHAKGMRSNLRPGQKLSYGALQFFYPSVAVVWLLGNFVSAMYFLLGVSSMDVNLTVWFYYWSLSLLTQLGLFTWLNRFNLTPHEQRHGGLDAMLLTLFTSPVYVAAGIAAVFRRPLAYAVTAKGNLSSPDSWRTYWQHIVWCLIAGTLAIIGFARTGGYSVQIGWALFICAVTALPLVSYLWIKYIWMSEFKHSVQDGIESMIDTAETLSEELGTALVNPGLSRMNLAPAYDVDNAAIRDTIEGDEERSDTLYSYHSTRRRPRVVVRPPVSRSALELKYINYTTRIKM